LPISVTGKSARKRRVRQNLSIVDDSTFDGVSQQVSACSVTASENTVMHSLCRDATEVDTAADRCHIHKLQSVRVTHQSDETSDDVSTRTSTAEECNRTDSDSSMISINSRRLGKYFTTAVRRSSDSVPVVKQTTSATAAAAAAATATAAVVGGSAVIHKPSSSSRQGTAVSTLTAGRSNDQVGATSRSKRRRCYTGGSDVEQSEATDTASTASCEYC